MSHLEIATNSRKHALVKRESEGHEPEQSIPERGVTQEYPLDSIASLPVSSWGSRHRGIKQQ
jgi:hypothetical protein